MLKLLVSNYTSSLVTHCFKSKAALDNVLIIALSKIFVAAQGGFPLGVLKRIL